MLDYLQIDNVGPLKRGEIDFGPGLSVITGETGAGKSMLLSSLSLLGGNAPEKIRSLKDNMSEDINVESTWSSSDINTKSMLNEILGQDDKDTSESTEDIVISRTISATSKRSKCFVQSKLVSNNALGALFTELVQIHGQSDHLMLKNNAKVLELVDNIALLEPKTAELYTDYREKYAQYRQKQSEIDAMGAQVAEMEKNEKYYEFAISSIESVGPQIDEDDIIAEKIKQIEDFANSSADFQEILSLIDGEDTQATSLLATLQLLENALNAPQFTTEYGSLSEKLAELNTLLIDLRSNMSEKIADNEPTENIVSLQQRAGELATLTASWGPKISDVLAFYDRAKDSLNGNIGQVLDKMQSELAEIDAELTTLAESITEIRTKTSAEFAEAIISVLEELNLSGATITFRWEKLPDFSANGINTCELLFSPHSSVTPSPIGKIASGGELSRIMLAVECVKARIIADSSGKDTDISGELPTLVFDEVDAGVGGETANKVADLLADVAKQTQVIVVTHLASVAARADNHLKIAKSSDAAAVSVEITPITGSEREQEIARMLAGTINETSLAHARELLG